MVIYILTLKIKPKMTAACLIYIKTNTFLLCHLLLHKSNLFLLSEVMTFYENAKLELIMFIVPVANPFTTCVAAFQHIFETWFFLTMVFFKILILFL